MAGTDITIEILKGIRREVGEIQKRFDAVDKRFDAVDKRFDAVDKRFDAVDKRFDSVDERIELTNQRLDITNGRLGVVESTLLTLARRQRATLKVVRAMAQGGTRLDARVTDLETRVDRLESK
jgi:chromosome segregation ATPase